MEKIFTIKEEKNKFSVIRILESGDLSPRATRVLKTRDEALEYININGKLNDCVSAGEKCCGSSQSCNKAYNDSMLKPVTYDNPVDNKLKIIQWLMDFKKKYFILN